jgi:hypothetical protein
MDDVFHGRTNFAKESQGFRQSVVWLGGKKRTVRCGTATGNWELNGDLEEALGTVKLSANDRL